MVEGAFAKVFKGVVHPVEILNAMQREAEAHKAILAGGRTLVPNRYVIDLSPYDHSRLAPYAAALAQAFNIGEAYGLDMDRLVEVMGAGSAGSVMLNLKARPMIERDYEPLFKLAHMLKDVRHCLDEARELGEDFELAAVAERLYAAADEAGRGEEDFAAVAEVVRATESAT
jgi:hypothetical protein